ncbi:MAG: AtpZ/AtpI family protein [Candidatus Electryoneaceae bacterium]|nr:AtpZ/AtpI family protein [Candidatus Electryoneaceae bacterium]
MPPRDYWVGATTYTHLGLTFAFVILGGFFGGYWLDGKIGTRPLLAIIGAFIGATGGFVYLIQTLKQMQKDEEDRSDKEQVNE